MRAEKNTYQSRGEYQSEQRRIPIRGEENTVMHKNYNILGKGYNLQR